MYIGLCKFGSHNLRTIIFQWITVLEYLFLSTEIYISVDKARYSKPFVENYLDTSTIKQDSKFHKTTLPHDMILTK